MRNLYTAINEIINTISFDSIYRGFSKFPFALYDDNNVYLPNETISYDRRFLGNTSIEYDGEYIAIWNIEDPVKEDPEILAADLVHEMFHAFQRKNNEKRFPSDLSMLDYPANKENFNIKYAENQLLAKALLSQDLQEKAGLISGFISSRRYREILINDIIRQEYLVETIEGMAEYAGCMALKQISESKYTDRINKYADNLRVLNEQFFDIRRMSYFTGAIFCITLLQAGIDFQHAINGSELPLFNIVAGNTSAKKPVVDFNNDILATELQTYLEKKKQKFDEFVFSHNGVCELDAVICGYDPMNMIKMDGRILCDRFIMLKSKDKSEPLFIQGPVMVCLKDGSVSEVKSYVKSK